MTQRICFGKLEITRLGRWEDSTAAGRHATFSDVSVLPFIQQCHACEVQEGDKVNLELSYQRTLR